MTYNEELAERMRKILKTRRSVIEKKMFGGIGFLVNGNMACGVNKQDLILHLSQNDFEMIIRRSYARMFDMTGRPMKGWILISSEGYKSEKQLGDWIEKGISFARSLPPK
jgi:TfoX/Sxy family transcriptional regulator of competence genes